MEDIKFGQGLKEYSLNGTVTVRFNPTDTDFAERLFRTFDELEQAHKKYKDDLEKLLAEDKTKVFDFMRERDAEMREKIDYVFETPICDALFGTMNVYAMADGLPVWMNLFFAVMDELDSAYAREQKQMNPRVAKYTEKYKKYQ